jgi:hypothetical protein
MRIPLIVSLCLCVAAAARAQTTETPVPFDSAGRILSVSASLASRLGLTPPVWPVTGNFAEARLYRVSTGGYLLAVTRPTGAVDRFGIDDGQAVALRAAFGEAILRSGGPVSEDAAGVIAEPARGPFVRDQMILAATLYGPALASLTDDGTVASGVYMMSVGGTFFALNDFARRRSVSKAQNALTTDGALRGWAAVNLAAAALDARYSEKGTAVLALTGGIGGSMIGFHRGRSMTNGEAQAAMTISTLAAGAAVGGLVTVVGDDIDDEGRSAAAAALIGGIAGYVGGPLYPRRQSYTVTAGDVQLLRMGSLLGTAAVITPFADADHMDTRVAAGILTAGWIGGALIADRIAARPFNHSESDSRMIHLGMIGGALMGASVPLMLEAESGVFWAGAITGGAILGAKVTQNMMAPAREGAVMRSVGSSSNGARVELNPDAVLFTAMKRPGNHALVSIRF